MCFILCIFINIESSAIVEESESKSEYECEYEDVAVTTKDLTTVFLFSYTAIQPDFVENNKEKCFFSGNLAKAHGIESIMQTEGIERGLCIALYLYRGWILTRGDENRRSYG